MDAPEEDFGALHKRIVDALLSTTRTTSQVCAEDLAFQRSFDPSIATALDRQHARILALAERLLGNAAAGTDLVSPRLSDSDAIDARWRGIVDVVDSLLERADMCLDEYNGVIKRGGQGQEQVNIAFAFSYNYFRLTSSRYYLLVRVQDC
jgi:exosome complex exonuclease RRP6